MLVTAGYHDYGGQSKANAALADYLLEQGRHVHLVGHDIDRRFAQRSEVTIHEVPRPAGSDLLGWLPLDWCGRRIARRVRAEFPGARIVVNGGCALGDDINWVHCVHHAWGFADAGAPLWFRVKNRMTKWWARRRERRAVRRARLVIANSAQTRDHLIRRCGVPPESTRVVYLGSDPAWTAVGEAERAAARRDHDVPAGVPVVLFAGALSHDHNKGFDTLLNAWKSLAPDWDALLLAAGDGNGRQTWQRRVAAAGLDRRVRFLGFTRRMPHLLASADLLVSPVRYEAYGLNVQEALCRGVPALVSRRAGIVEQLERDVQEMILADPEDAADLAARLRAWRTDINGWRERIRPVSRRLRLHDWNAMARQIVSLAETSATSEVFKT
ncbi:MAG: glycosyltransferase family 4 protein [Gemmataceae bacterium]|nr:glycosyltransferase family 4 protein [Gemmataceae bacterium]